MSYPNLPIMRDGTSAERQGGIDPVRATNGTLKVRRLYSADKIHFTIVHWLSDEQLSTLQAAYTAFKNSTVTLTWPEDGQNYVCVFAAAPQYEKRTGYTVATVQLWQV